jgi:photosynthetic reaction center cytochrome c subunit
MASITQWVAPTQGCNYCHNPNNMAEDSVYTKVVARRMLQMTQNINQNWSTHVVATGVTCYTCHRGNPVPAQVWFNDAGHPQAHGAAQAYTGKNEPSKAAGFTALATDPFTPFLQNASVIRVQGTTALPAGNLSSIKQTDWTYALMMHMSTGLGVNCTYCHNSRAFGDWSESAPQRVTAWYGIRMVRQINNEYMTGLTNVFPTHRLGPAGDVAKVNCATCHQGVYKPLYGVSMAKDFPELRVVSATKK